MNTATNTSKADCHCSKRVIGRILLVGSKLNTGDDPEEPLTLKLYCWLSVSADRSRAKSIYSSAQILALILSETRLARGTDTEVNFEVGLSTGLRSPVISSTTELMAPEMLVLGVALLAALLGKATESDRSGCIASARPTALAASMPSLTALEIKVGSCAMISCRGVTSCSVL